MSSSSLLIVDVNEQTHYAKKRVDRAAWLADHTGLRTVVRPMQCGDYALQLCDDTGGIDDGRTMALIERKMAQDMASSQHDSRYHSQAERMEKSGVPALYWLIIGSQLRDPSTASAVESGMVHLSTPDYPNTRVLHLPDDTDQFAVTLQRLERYLFTHYTTGSGRPDLPLYTAAQEAGAKPRLDTQAVVWLEQLTIPRGMSRTKARAVAAKYPSFSSLARAYRTLPAPPPTKNKKRTLADAQDLMLEDIPLPGGKRLGRACSTIIRRTMFVPGDDDEE